MFRITTDHIYHVGTGAILTFDNDLLFCVDGRYYACLDRVTQGDDATIMLYEVDAPEVNGDVLVDANVAVEE